MPSDFFHYELDTNCRTTQAIHRQLLKLYDSAVVPNARGPEGRDPELHQSLARSLEFLQHFIHPDGTLGGEYSSRNTTFYYPAGLEMLAGTIPAARAIAGFLRRRVGEPPMPGPCPARGSTTMNGVRSGAGALPSGGRILTRR